MNNNQTFKPDNQTIAELFSCLAIYVIPNYQRQYSWTNEQLEELWNDLYESYINNPNECYFLGSIVVVDDGNGRHELVDGQQRITTLMIMLNVLAKTFPNINENSESLLKGNLQKIKQLIYFDEGINRLQLQIDPNYNTSFKKVIINQESYEYFEYPSQANLKKDNPEYKFINTAKFFYDKFNELLKNEGQKELDNFVNFILFQTNIIKTVCTNQSFAIKLFLVLNDRGLELSVSDIIKSYLLDKYDSNDRYHENDKATFISNWKSIEKICNDNEFTIDDFMVYFEYYKLKSNPKNQVTDELKRIIQSSEVVSLVDEMKSFADNVEKVYKSTDPIIYSLRYIPWQAYVITALASIYQVNYSNKEELLNVMRRFFYISWISGKTLNGIKQTSFNLIEAIVDKKTIAEIKEMLNKFIYEKKLISNLYQVLEDDVYGQNFLKALILSLEYTIREKTNTSFYKINNTIHIDHILPQHFDKRLNEWENIENVDEAKTYIHKLGNLALLLGSKNEEALNHGMNIKMKIYQGKDRNESGITAFDTTKTIIDNYNKGDSSWDIYHIEKRQEYLMNLIENMLNVSKEEIENEAIVYTKEISIYTEEEHLKDIPENIKDIYLIIKNKIIELDDIDIEYKKTYIAFKGRTNIVDIILYKYSICLYINLKKGQLEDPFNIAEDVSNVGHPGNGDYRVQFDTENKIENAMFLIKQSLEVNKKIASFKH